MNLGQPVRPGGALSFGARRPPSCDGMSPIMREVHVRVCEGLGVKFPGPTRQTRKSVRTPGMSALGGKADEIGQIADIHAGHRIFASPAAKMSK